MLVNPIIFGSNNGNGNGKIEVKTFTFTGNGAPINTTEDTPYIQFPEKPYLILQIKGNHDYNNSSGQTYEVNCQPFLWGTSGIMVEYYGLASIGIGSANSTGFYYNTIKYDNENLKLIFVKSTTGDPGCFFNGKINKDGSLVGSTYTVSYIPESCFNITEI